LIYYQRKLFFQNEGTWFLSGEKKHGKNAWRNRKKGSFLEKYEGYLSSSDFQFH